MPELPDIEVYLEALRPRIEGQPLEAARLGSPFLLRTSSRRSRASSAGGSRASAAWASAS